MQSRERSYEDEANIDSSQSSSAVRRAESVFDPAWLFAELDVEDNEIEPEPDKEAPDGATKAESPMVAYLEQMFSKRLDAMQSMVERLPGVSPPIRKINPDSYADAPSKDEITLIEMPKKFSFPSPKAYDGTTDPDDHVAQY
ncbi:hypothetical protein DY000_02053188 [Brassica cretica]|uniref:Uncharacterized protein n=1 Tax=Brassica cretica TaxID=69181 RepID=A0ABQ7AHR2_BRACR|nr:hypothetical protein DY000_02053188 [Brassica cretica]